MTRRLLPVLVLVVALAALAGTISYAVARATNGTDHFSMMSGPGSDYAMMNSSGHRIAWYLNGSGAITTIGAARSQAQRFADRLGLKTGEVMQFSNNFYVLLTDKQGGAATEVLVDPQSGAVTLEYGPAMMWNTRYGMMSRSESGDGGGMMGNSGVMMGNGAGSEMMNGSAGPTDVMGQMMGRYGSTPTWTPANVRGPFDVTRAQTLANRWLARTRRGEIAAQPDSLPGYFTFHALRHGKITGMLSVDKTSGAVWYHWWHGRFLSMAE